MHRIPEAERPLGVLIVDGDDDTAASTAEVLALHGFPCRAVGGGEAAVSAAAAAPPDVVFVELLLGRTDGCDVARRLSDLPGEGRPLLVALTVCGREEDRRRASAAGFDLHIVKPAEPVALVGLLKQVRGALARSGGRAGGHGQATGAGDAAPAGTAFAAPEPRRP